MLKFALIYLSLFVLFLTFTPIISPKTIAEAPECNNLTQIWNGQFGNNWEDSANFNVSTSGKFFTANRFLASDGIKQTLETVFNQGSYGVNQSGIPIGGTGWQNKPNAFTSTDEACFSYDLKFDTDFDFNKGGKLPGFYGGNSPTGGQNPTGTDGFTTRLMWRTGGAGEVYAYVPSSAAFGTSLGRGSWIFSTGNWQKISQYVKLNTPGISNGIITIWINDVQKYHVSNIEFRTASSLKIDGIISQTFFGGNDSSWASPKTQKLSYSNFNLKSSAINIPINLILKVILQGAWNSYNSTMKTTLRSKGLIPLNGQSSLPVDSVDWVTIELRKEGILIDTKMAILKQDGFVDKVSFYQPPSYYYVTARHRNHLPIQTKVAQNMNELDNYIDFTNGTNQMMVQSNINGDNLINSVDRNLIRKVPEESNVYSDYDINLDGIISSIDRNTIRISSDSISLII